MAEHRTLNPQVEGSIPSAPIRAISHEVALFFARRQGAGTRPIPLALHTRSIRPIPLALHTRSIRPIPLRSIRALRRLCARACALARIRRRLRYCPQRGAIRSASYSSISCLCLPKQGYLRARCSPPPPRFRLDFLHIDHIIVKIILIFSIA